MTGGSVSTPASGPRVTIEVPAGALTEQFKFTVTPIPGRLPGAAGPAIEATPHGAIFAKPVALRFAVKPEDIAPGVSVNELRVATLQNGKWELLPTSHPEAGVIGPCLRGGDGQVQVSVRKRPTVAALLHHTMLFRWTNLFRRAYRAYRGRGQDLTTTHAVEVLLGAALFLRREVFAECGPWDERYTFGGEDIDLCTRIGRRYQAVYHPDVEITHFGRVSTRQHIGFAHSNTVNGITRFLRRSGTPRPALWLYKTALTLDAPLQWLRHGVNYLSQRLRGRSRQAAKSLLALRGAGHFLTRGLLGFWPA